MNYDNVKDDCLVGKDCNRPRLGLSCDRKLEVSSVKSHLEFLSRPQKEKKKKKYIYIYITQRFQCYA